MAARLRMDSSATDEERHERVRFPFCYTCHVSTSIPPDGAAVTQVLAVLSDLGMSHRLHVRVGNDGDNSGLSGGERRRVTVAEALITNPSVIMLDEPTSGLDSTSAYSLMQLLSVLARKNRTIVCTIHQPRREVFELVDKLLVCLSRPRSLFVRGLHTFCVAVSAWPTCVLWRCEQGSDRSVLPCWCC